MKRNKLYVYVALITVIVSSNTLKAQNDYDALRFSTTYHGGTARVMAMGGAFSALGSDISSASVNPAGLGLYRSSDVNLSFGYNMNSTQTDFLGKKTTDTYFGVETNSMGTVLSFPNKDNYTSGTGKICTNMAITYNRINSYNQNLLATGRSNDFTYLASVPYFGQNTLDFFKGTGAIYEDGTNDFDIDGKYQQQQTFKLLQRGSVNDLNLAFGFNESNKTFYGFSVGLVSMSHEEEWNLVEDDVDDLTLYTDAFEYSNIFRRDGIGVNLKAGFMRQINSSMKVSLAVHTPTILKIEEEWDQELMFDFTDSAGQQFYIDSIALYGLNYTVVTPAKVVVGLSYLINNMVLLSADYEGTPFKAMRLMSDDYTYSDVNQDIKDYYQWRHGARLGFEVKLGMVSLRGGGFYYSSPLKSVSDEIPVYGYSAGLGYRSGNFYLDFAFQNMIQASNIYIDGNVFDNDAMKVGVESTRTNVIATIGFRF